MKKIVLLFCLCCLYISSYADYYYSRQIPVFFKGCLTCPDETILSNGDFSPTADKCKLSDTLSYYYELLYTSYDFTYNEDGILYLHDSFGKRSIDLYSDLLSGDMTQKESNYGWFVNDANGALNEFRSRSLWYQFQRFIYSINKALLDFPSASTEEPAAYAQLLGLRGYCFSRLATWCTPAKGFSDYTFKKDYKSPQIGPIFTSANFNESDVKISSWYDFYQQAVSDLEEARNILIQQKFHRSDKLQLDSYVISGILAQTCLNFAIYLDSDEQAYFLNQALSYSEYVLNNNEYTVLPVSQVLTDGFNNIDNTSWLWGLNTDSTNAGALKSFFGNVDIYTYSYAWAGDVKGIDEALYHTIPEWDMRKQWFKASNPYMYAPYKKFFSAINHTSTKEKDVDRDWMSDDVYMRYESVLLTAAEAQYRLGNYSQATTYLRRLTDKRVKEGQKSAYENEVNQWGNADRLKEAIIYNWRVELWGEGYGLETFRRWGEPHTLGSNQSQRSNQTIQPTDSTFQILYDSGFNRITNTLTLETHFIGEKSNLTVYINNCTLPYRRVACMMGDFFQIWPWLDEDLLFTGWEDGTLTLPRAMFAISREMQVRAYFTSATDIENIEKNAEQRSKILKNGHIYILQHNKTYDILGR